MDACLLATNSDEAAILTTVLSRAGLRSRLIREFDNWIGDLKPHTLQLALLAPGQQLPVRWVQALRGVSDAAIFVIIDPIPEELHVELLSAGVDVLITRPYSARILVAQIKSLLRRSGSRLLSSPAYTLGEIKLDPSHHTVLIADSPPVRLTKLEFRLLLTLMHHAGQILSAENLVGQVWGYSGEGDRHLVRGLVKRVRAKIEPDPAHPRFIHNEPGLGYVFIYDES